MAVPHTLRHAIKHNLNFNTLLSVVVILSIERGFRKFDNALDSIQELKYDINELRYRVSELELSTGTISASLTNVNRYHKVRE